MDTGPVTSRIVQFGGIVLFVGFLAALMGVVLLVLKRTQIPKPLFLTLMALFVVCALGFGLVFLGPSVDVVTTYSSGEGDDSGG